jgi:hypothetical protein
MHLLLLALQACHTKNPGASLRKAYSPTFGEGVFSEVRKPLANPSNGKDTPYGRCARHPLLAILAALYTAAGLTCPALLRKENRRAQEETDGTDGCSADAGFNAGYLQPGFCPGRVSDLWPIRFFDLPTRPTCWPNRSRSCSVQRRSPRRTGSFLPVKFSGPREHSWPLHSPDCLEDKFSEVRSRPSARVRVICRKVAARASPPLPEPVLRPIARTS